MDERDMVKLLQNCHFGFFGLLTSLEISAVVIDHMSVSKVQGLFF